VPANKSGIFPEAGHSKKESRSVPREDSHILVIRLSALGDVAMTVPVLLSLVESYPDLRITLLTRGFFKPLFSEIERVTIYEAATGTRHKGVCGLWRLFRELRALQIDAVADLHNVLRSNILKFFYSFSAVPFMQINKGRADKKALTAVRNKVFKPLKSTHERYADVFEKLGFPVRLSPNALLPSLDLGDATSAFAGPRLNIWIGVAPFAAFKGKMYPPDLMEKVLHLLNETERYKIILFGGGKEEENQLSQWERQFEFAISAAGRLTFREELELISNLDLMVAMDSANGHLAALYGVPTLTLWGVTHPYAGFYPFAQDPANALLADRAEFPSIPTSVYGNKFPEGYEKAIATITPESVVSKIEQVLSGPDD